MSNSSNSSFNDLSDKIIKKVEWSDFSQELFDDLKPDYKNLSKSEKDSLLSELNHRIQWLKKLKETSEENWLFDKVQNFDNQIKAYERIVSDLNNLETKKEKINEAVLYDKLYKLYQEFKNDKNRKDHEKWFVFFWSYIKNDKDLLLTYWQLWDIFEDLSKNKKDKVIKYFKDNNIIKDSNDDENNPSETLDPEKEKLKEENKELKEKLDKLEKELSDMKEKMNEILKKLSENKEVEKKEEDKEENKESVEKINELTRDLDNQDINYKKDMKKKVEENLRIWWTLILVKWSSQIARLQKIDEKWFKCITCTDDKLKILIDKDHYIIENWNKSYISYIKKEDLREFINFKEKENWWDDDDDKKDNDDNDKKELESEDLNLSSVISDMWTDVHRERVSLETEEELKDYYKWLDRYRLDKRAYLFLSRWAKRKRMIEEWMDKLSWKAFSGDDSLDDKTTNAADRHELEKNGYKLDWIKSVVEKIDDPKVNEICKKYIDADWVNLIYSDDDFKKDFNAITENKTTVLGKALEWKKDQIKYIWTNILENLKLKKDEKVLKEKIYKWFDLYIKNSDDSIISNLEKDISKHIEKYKQNPDFIKNCMNIFEEDPNQDKKLSEAKKKEKIENYLKHHWAILKMWVANVKMSIDIITWWKSAYQIDNKDRQKWFWYKVWKTLDKLPRWAQTAWFVWISIGTWLLTWWLGTVAAAAITTWVSAWTVWWLNAFKKRTHYTKEQNTHEKNIVTDNKAEKQRIAELQNLATTGKRYNRKTYKAKRQLKLYNEATQQDFKITDDITQAIMLEASKISWMDKAKLEGDLIIWLARLDYYREVWHNFLASDDKEKIESDFNKLEKSIILWLNRLWTDLNTFRQKPEIWALKDTLKKDYDKSFKHFKKERRILAAKYGVSTAALSAWMSVGMQWLTWSWLFSDKAVDWVAATNFTNNTTDTFDLWKAELLDTATKNDLYNTWTNILKNPSVIDWSNITINYGAWTDATSVIPWRLTESIYEAKIDNVINNIKSLSLDSTTKDMLIKHIESQPRQSSREASNFMNDYLHGMRCAEAVEQVAKSVADSGRNNITLNINYDSTMDIVWKSIKDASERVVNANFLVDTPEIPWVVERSRWRFLQFPVFFNTFKDKKIKEDKKPEDKTDKWPNDKPNAPKDKEKITDKRKYRDDFRDRNKEKPNQDPDDPWIKKDPKTWEIKPVQDLSKKNVWVSTRKEHIFIGRNSLLWKDWKAIIWKDWKPIEFDWYKDIENFAPEYPNKFWEKTLDEIATEVIDNPNIPLYKDSLYENNSTEVEDLLTQWKRQEAIEKIKRILIKEREYIKEEQEKKYNWYIDQIYNTIKKAFEKYWVKDLENTLPSKDKIHIMSWYEFWAYQKPRVNQEWKMTWWVCYTDHWHILINNDAIHMVSTDKQTQESTFKDIMIHELMHDSWVNNYHHFYELKDKSKSDFEKQNRDKEMFIVRRIWLKIIRRLKWNTFFVYWTAINEAVTQMIADEIWKSKYDWTKSLLPETYKSRWYPREKEIIVLLQKKFDIPFDMFAKAILNRTRDDDKENNYLRNINELVNWKTVEWLWKVSYKRPEMLRLLMCIMDYESQPSVKGFSDEYKLTKALINWEELIITEQIKKYLHPGLLKDWILKQEILSAYPNIKDEKSTAIAA